MRLIDTHCHLNDAEAFPDPAAAVEEAAGVGIEKLIVVGVDTESSQRAVELADQFDAVYAVVGWHPNYASDYKTSELVEIERLLAHPKTVALGEIGLDFYRDHATMEEQHKCVLEQLDLAESTGAPIVFHCRDAYPQLLDILEKRKVLPYLFHCFAGCADDAKRCLALESYFGVDGPVTYKRSDELREILGWLPKEKLLIETDAPWMSPIPFRGKRNKPAWLTYINSGLADAISVNPAECAEITTANAERFFDFSR
jgi:TatD DNase family protein